jgi:hypothetical protein
MSQQFDPSSFENWKAIAVAKKENQLVTEATASRFNEHFDSFSNTFLYGMSPIKKSPAAQIKTPSKPSWFF